MTAETIGSSTEPDPSTLAISRDPKGIPVESNGRTWMLARLGLARVITDQRDVIYEDMTLHDDVGMKEIRHCAWAMLTANYRLEPAQAIAVLDGIDNLTLSNAVLDGIMPDRHGLEERSYTAWARSSLLANGIDPAKIAVEDLPHVLRQLVATGRAMKLEQFTSAAAHVAMREELMRGV